MTPNYGPFHSLTDEDKHHLTQLLTHGTSVRSAAHQIKRDYSHCLSFAHHQGLITPRTHQHIEEHVIDEFLALVTNQQISINKAAGLVGIPESRAYHIAMSAGIHIRHTQYQRVVIQTDKRIDYLRLRLASLSPGQAAKALGIGLRQARDYDKGLTLGPPRTRFLPAGPDTATYNRLMTAVLTRNDIIEQGRLAEPALPPGVNPFADINRRYLNTDDRVLIADLYRQGQGVREIARQVGRAPSTISRELRRNHSAQGPYYPHTAQKKAAARRLRPKIAKILAHRPLYDYVVDGLRNQWSPEAIANRIQRDHPYDQAMRISHETIYDSFYLDTKGRLKDLGLSLPTGRKKRRSAGRARGGDTGRFVDTMIMIDDRPEEVEQRLVPGHWEGDLILGAGNKSAVITLVERVSRFVALGHLPTNHGSDEVLRVLTEMVSRLDESMWSSITWDQGSEMAGHKAFTMGTKVAVYFCHPGSPWERGSNENTNGRLRRNLPKSSDLSVYSAQDLEVIANIHNHKPRKVLDWLTPAEVMAAALRVDGSIR